MHMFWYTLLFTAFAWLVMTVQSRRPIVAIVLVGVMALTLVSPTPAHAQGGVLTGIQAILSLINGVIKTALGAINTVRTAVNNSGSTPAAHCFRLAWRACKARSIV